MAIVRGLATTVDAVTPLAGVRCSTYDTHASPALDVAPDAAP